MKKQEVIVVSSYDPEGVVYVKVFSTLKKADAYFEKKIRDLGADVEDIPSYIEDGYYENDNTGNFVQSESCRLED